MTQLAGAAAALAPAAERGAALERALRDAGVSCTVEARERLAVLVPSGGSALADLADPERRRETFALAVAHGFTHLAVELVEAVPAPVPPSSAAGRAPLPGA